MVFDHVRSGLWMCLRLDCVLEGGVTLIGEHLFDAPVSAVEDCIFISIDLFRF